MGKEQGTTTVIIIQLINFYSIFLTPPHSPHTSFIPIPPFYSITGVQTSTPVVGNTSRKINKSLNLSRKTITPQPPITDNNNKVDNKPPRLEVSQPTQSSINPNEDPPQPIPINSQLKTEEKVEDQSTKKTLPSKNRHLFRACTDIHTTPTKLIKELLNPNSSIRLNGIKKSGGGGGGVPPPRIVYDSTTIDNTASLAIEDLDNNNSNVDGKAPAAGGGGENNKRTVVMAFYRASPTKKDQLLEFLRKYETWGLAEGGFVIGFCTINPKDLPPGSVAPEEYQKGITDGKWEVVPGWDEMGNYVLRGKDYGQTELEFTLVVEVDPCLMSILQVNY